LKTLDEVFEGFKQLKVLIIGDVMIDAYTYGTVSRISPEAPVPIVNVRRQEKRLGGAANVALNIQALGATPILCSVIGEDDEANAFIELLHQSEITSKGIIRSTHRITTVKNRIIAGSQQMLRIDSEQDKPLNDLEHKSIVSQIKLLLEEVDLVIFEDYDKGTIDKNLIEETVAFAKSKRIPTAVDPKKRNFMDYSGVSLFKPNLKELKEGLKVEFDHKDPIALEEAVSSLESILKFKSALITLSENGVLISNEGVYSHIPAHIRSIADVSGAGDTVISIAGLCLALKVPAQFIAEMANLGGGLVCEHVGVVPIDLASLRLEAEKYNLEALLG
jgi:rfaE bifunctional protein kinase chain/domain